MLTAFETQERALRAVEKVHKETRNSEMQVRSLKFCSKTSPTLTKILPNYVLPMQVSLCVVKSFHLH